MSQAMSHARIYQPAKTAMQSGWADTRRWILEFEPRSAPTLDPLTGWSGSGDPEAAIRLVFATREEAMAYAERKGLTYTVREPKQRRVRPKNYSDKFRYDQVR